MESQSQKLISILEATVSLLKLCDTQTCKAYCGYLKRLLLQLNRHHELHKVAADILKIYGGMGSFNDLGIYKDSNLLREEDIKFEQVTTELFLACKEAIASSRGGQ